MTGVEGTTKQSYRVMANVSFFGYFYYNRADWF